MVTGSALFILGRIDESPDGHRQDKLRLLGNAVRLRPLFNSLSRFDLVPRGTRGLQWTHAALGSGRTMRGVFRSRFLVNGVGNAAIGCSIGSPCAAMAPAYQIRRLFVDIGVDYVFMLRGFMGGVWGHFCAIHRNWFGHITVGGKFGTAAILFGTAFTWGAMST